MTWKQIKQPEDPDWVEWHKEITIFKWDVERKFMLKVWQNMDGYFSVAMVDKNNYRMVKALGSTTIESAKSEAEKWARGE